MVSLWNIGLAILLYNMSGLFPTNHISSKESIMKQWIPTNFPRHQAFPVRITTIVSPSNFWIQLEGPQYYDQLEKLELQMDFFYIHLQKGECFYQEIDDMKFNCYAAIVFNGIIRRVLILRLQYVSNQIVAIVFHCDYGLVTKVECEKLMKLHPNFAYFPQQAIWATLANVVPKDFVLPWKLEVCNKFAFLIKDKTVEAQLVGANVNKFKMHLQINDITNRHGDININDTLVQLGHAKIGRTIDFEM